MSLFAKLFARRSSSNSDFAAVRMSRGGHHYYTILASDLGFEYVFRNGTDRWSTISPSFANRLLEKNREGKMGNQIASNRKQFLQLAIGSIESGPTSWNPSKEISYPNREIALTAERKILDISWANVKDKLDDQ